MCGLVSAGKSRGMRAKARHLNRAAVLLPVKKIQVAAMSGR
jgi:hypothetical protein